MPVALARALSGSTSRMGLAGAVTAPASAGASRWTPSCSTLPHAWHSPHRPTHFSDSHPHSPHRYAWRVGLGVLAFGMACRLAVDDDSSALDANRVDRCSRSVDKSRRGSAPLTSSDRLDAG